MRLPFSNDQFYSVFRDYNTAVWPVQIALILLAISALALVVLGYRNSGRWISLILSLLWLWMAVVYHGIFFSRINPAAYVFAFLFLAGSALFGWYGFIQGRMSFQPLRAGVAMLGWSLVLYAMVVYPASLYAAGHHFPWIPTFGLPCPTTLFTIGLLVFLRRPFPRIILVVPILWCAIGAQAAFLLGVPQDLGLLVAAVVGVTLFIRGKRPPETATQGPMADQP